MIRTLILAFAVAFGATGAFAATLNVDGTGQLLGAFNVDVGGRLYDVHFVDGTCFDLFSGCDEPSDFTFQSLTDARAASQSLIDQVFLDVGAGSFDSDPELTIGCAYEESCVAITPYQRWLDSRVFTSVSVNQWNDEPGIAGEYALASLFDDMSAADAGVFASWTLVPEPGTGLLVVGGLVLLSARRRSLERAL